MAEGSEHVRDLQRIVDDCKARQHDQDAYIRKLESQMAEQKVEIEVARRRATAAETELLTLRKTTYQQELKITEQRGLIEELTALRKTLTARNETLEYEQHKYKLEHH